MLRHTLELPGPGAWVRVGWSAGLGMAPATRLLVSLPPWPNVPHLPDRLQPGFHLVIGPNALEVEWDKWSWMERKESQRLQR